MGIIAALKKRYKFLHLRDVLEFYDLDESTKAKKNRVHWEITLRSS